MHHRPQRLHVDELHLAALEGSPHAVDLELINRFLRQRRSELLCKLLADFTEKAETELLYDGGHNLLAGFTEFVQNYEPILSTTGEVGDSDSEGGGRKPSVSGVMTRATVLHTEGLNNENGSDGWVASFSRTWDQLRRLPLFPEASEGTVLKRCFLLFEDSSKSILGKVILLVIVLTIAVSTVTYVMESMPDLRDRQDECAERLKLNLKLTVAACEPRPRAYFATIEAVCIIIFTVDYAVRAFTVHAGSQSVSSALLDTFRYVKKPVNIVDLVAILPFYLQVGFGTGELLDKFRVLRLVRILRIFKLAKLNPGVQMFWEVLTISGQPLLILMFLDAIIILVFGALIFCVEGSTYSVDAKFTQPKRDALGNITGEAEYPTGAYVREDWNQGNNLELTPFRSIPYAVWWVCVTTTTVGYGDYAPKTALGQFLGVACFYTGIIFLALPISVLGSNFEIVFRRHGHTDRPKKRKRRRVSVIRPLKETPWLPDAENLRKQIFILFECPAASRIGKIISLLVMVTIFVVTVAFIMESMPNFKNTPEECNPDAPTVDECEPKPLPLFNLIEVVGIAIFTVDYVCRVATVHAVSADDAGIETLEDQHYTSAQLTRVYATQWLNIVDFLAIAPFYVQLCFGAEGISSFSSVLRVLRLIRVFRVLKMPQLSTCVTMFVSIVSDSMPAIFLLFFLTLVASVLIASCIVFAEGSYYSVDRFTDEYPMGVYIRQTFDGRSWEPSPFKSIPSAFWWFFTTATTVGFGDFYPTTGFGRFVAVLTFYLGIVLLALPITIIGGQFDTHYNAWLKEIQEMTYADNERLKVSLAVASREAHDRLEDGQENNITTKVIVVQGSCNQGASESIPSPRVFHSPENRFRPEAYMQDCVANEMDSRISNFSVDESGKVIGQSAEGHGATGQPSASGQEPLRGAASGQHSPSSLKVAWS
jgi:hypothetical protein